MEIKTLNPTPPTIDTFTFDGVSKTDCVLKVPNEAKEAYKAAPYWNTFWSLLGFDAETCAKPVIAFVNGELSVTSETLGAKCYTIVTPEDNKTFEINGKIALSGIYKISAFAHADGYNDSERVTMMLYWSKPSFDAEAEMTLVGDVNEDGEVDVNDVVTLVGIILDK